MHESRSKHLTLDVGRSSFAFATARQVSACHAEAFGVGAFDVFFLFAAPHHPSRRLVTPQLS
jgi:hypothetical protein